MGIQFLPEATPPSFTFFLLVKPLKVKQSYIAQNSATFLLLGSFFLRLSTGSFIVEGIQRTLRARLADLIYSSKVIN